MAVGCALGCTQVHMLGPFDEGADDATSSLSTETTGGTNTSTETETDTGDELESTEDESSTDTTGETETTGETGDDPVPEACEAVDLGGTDGLMVDIMLMTQWDMGACYLVKVTNESGDDLIWTRDLRLGGLLDNYWNAEAEELTTTDWRFGGKENAQNILVMADETVEFGICMECEPEPESP